jgi:acyl-homoserine lactone acylase PvdQ
MIAMSPNIPDRLCRIFGALRLPNGICSPPVLALLVIPALTMGCSPSEPRDFEELAAAHLAIIDGEIQLPRLKEEVEVLRDPWGVPHIYAQNLDDLFFAQGYVQAQDRLWQMEMYRRAGEGRLSEVLGPEALTHDRLARLLKYRGPWTDEEFSSYHPEGRRILEAFVASLWSLLSPEFDRNPGAPRLPSSECRRPCRWRMPDAKSGWPRL